MKGGVEALVPALSTCASLQKVRINQNPSITTRGWKSLGTILESPNLTELDVDQNNVDDEAAAAFFIESIDEQPRVEYIVYGRQYINYSCGMASLFKTPL